MLRRTLGVTQRLETFRSKTEKSNHFIFLLRIFFIFTQYLETFTIELTDYFIFLLGIIFIFLFAKIICYRNSFLTFFSQNYTLLEHHILLSYDVMILIKNMFYHFFVYGFELLFIQMSVFIALKQLKV